MRLISALLIIVLTPFFIWENEIASATARWLNAGASRAGICAAVVVLLTLDVLLPVPSSFVSVAAGAFLGFQVGFLANWTGMMAGSCVGYALGRGAERWVRGRLLSEREWLRLQNRLQEYSVITVLLSRPVPVLAEMVVLAAGVLKLPWPRLLGISALGNGVIAAIYAGVGAFGFSRERLLAAFAIMVIVPWLSTRFFSSWLNRSRTPVKP